METTEEKKIETVEHKAVKDILADKATNGVHKVSEFVKPKQPQHKKVFIILCRKGIIIGILFVICEIASRVRLFQHDNKTLEFIIGSIVDHMIFPDISAGTSLDMNG